jgi:hypothetical protein
MITAGDAQVGKPDLRAAALGTAWQKARPKTTGGQNYSRQRDVKRLLSPALSTKGGEGENAALFGDN